MTSNTIWYAYTPARSVTIEANTFGSSYDTKLGLYTQSSGVFSFALTCNDDAGGGLQSQIGATLTGGTTYYFQVGGFGSNAGSTVFNLTTASYPTVVPKVSGKVATDGLVTLNGSVVCRGGTTGELTALWVSQLDRQGTETGYSGVQDVYTACGDPFSMTFYASSGTFVTGKILVSSWGYFSNDDFSGLAMNFETAARLGAAR